MQASPSRLERLTGGDGGGPRPLKIEAAQVAGDVDGFSDEEEARDVAGFEGAGVEVGGVDTAGGDLGLLKSFRADGMKLPSTQAALGGFDGGVGPVLGRRDFREPIGEALREHGAEGVAESRWIAAGLRLEQGTEDAGAWRQSGREIDRQRRAGLPIRRGLKNGGAAEAAMGEEHLLAKTRRMFPTLRTMRLSEGWGTPLLFGGCGPSDDISGDAGERSPMRFLATEDEGNQRRPRLDDAKTELPGKIVGKGRCAELGDGKAAGGDDESVRYEFASGAEHAETSGGIAIDLDVACVRDQFAAAARALGKEHVENGAGRVVAKELAKGFLVPRDAVAIDEFEEMAGLVERERGFGEVRVGGEKAVGRAVNVGEVASAAAGDEDFAAGLRVVFEQDGSASALAGDRGTHEAGGTGSQDRDIERARGGAHAGRAPANRSRIRASASSGVATAPSSWASSAAWSISLNCGPGV